jgi:hypothetical protein
VAAIGSLTIKRPASPTRHQSRKVFDGERRPIHIAIHEPMVDHEIVGRMVGNFAVEQAMNQGLNPTSRIRA